MSSVLQMKITDINNNLRDCNRAFLDPNWPGYVSVNYPSKSAPEKTRTDWIPIQTFIDKNPNYQDLIENYSDQKPLPPQITGITTSAQENSLSDTTQNWQKNIYAGFFVWISRGLGEGQVKCILANTKNKLLLDSVWEIKPNKTSQYTIVYLKPSVSVMNNTLPNT